MSEFVEFGNLPTEQDPFSMQQRSQPAQAKWDWAKILPAIGLVAGALHGHRARKKMMDASGDYISRRRILDESLYGATLGWVPQVLRDARDGMNEKTAGVGLGAGLGNMLLGPLGAGIGATMEKDPDYKYYGSPGLRAAAGSTTGATLGALAGLGIARLSQPRMSDFLEHFGDHPKHALLMAALMGAGSLAGAVVGAKSVNARPFNEELRKTASPAVGGALGGRNGHTYHHLTPTLAKLLAVPAGAFGAYEAARTVPSVKRGGKASVLAANKKD